MKRYWYIWLLAPVLLLVTALSAAWLSRGALAEIALARYCAGKDMTCSADISIPSLTRLIAENASLKGKESGTGLKLGRADIELSWPAMFRPKVLSVGLEQAAADGWNRPASHTGP